MSHKILAIAGTAVALTGAALVAGPVTTASASPIQVTTQADGGPGSLRAAIELANSTVGPDEIALPPGTYRLTIPPDPVNGNATGDLDVERPLTIVGTAGAAATIIDANGIDRAITADDDLVMSGITVANGKVATPGGIGGNIFVSLWGTLDLRDSVVKNGHALYGGGVGAYGYVEMMRTSVTDNRAEWVPGNGSSGGGVFVSASASMESLLVARNTADGGNGGGMALQSPPGQLIAVFNSTVTDNEAYATGGIIAGAGGEVVLSHMTVAGNRTEDDLNAAAGVSAYSDTNVSIDRSILAGNTTTLDPKLDECMAYSGGSIGSLGSNLSDDATCTTFTGAGDTTNDAGAALQPLAANGGPTRTMALGVGSTAIDTAACGPLDTDQRGLPRPVGSNCDKGAYESQGGNPPPSSTPSTTTPPTSAPPTSTTTPPPPSTAPPTTAPPTTAPPSTAPPTTVPPTAPSTTTAPSSTTSSTAVVKDPVPDRPPATEPWSTEAPSARVLGASLEAGAEATSTTAGPARVVSGSLPVTGASTTTPMAVLGGGFVLAGSALVSVARRNRHEDGAAR